MRIALIGTGLMGRPMAERLLAAGHPLTVYNRTRDKAEALAERGAKVAESASEALLTSDVTVLMLADGAAIRQALEPFFTHATGGGHILIQMGTISPRESIDLHRQITASGGLYFEAPVLGSRPQASAGTLQIMTGGDPDLIDRCVEVLTCFGPAPVRVGPVGAAAALKLALNQLIATHAAGFSMALGLVRSFDIDIDQFMEVLRQSAYYAPTYDAKLSGMLRGKFDSPNFPVRLMQKDVQLAQSVASEQQLNPALLEGLAALYEAAATAGLEEADYSAVCRVVDPRR